MKRLLVLVLCLSILFSAVSCKPFGAGGETGTSEDTTADEITTEAETEEEEDNRIFVDFGSYESILEMYRQIAKNARLRALDGPEEYDAMFAFADEEAYQMYLRIANAVQSVYPAFEKNTELGDDSYLYGYAEADFNQDGLNELVLLTDDYVILSIFTISAYSRKPVLLEVFEAQNPAWVDREGYIRVSDPTAVLYPRSQTVYKVRSDGTWEAKFVLGRDKNGEFYCIEDGVRKTISGDEYESLLQTNPIFDRSTCADMTRVHSALRFRRVIEVTDEYEAEAMGFYMDALNGEREVVNLETMEMGDLDLVCFTSGKTFGETETVSYAFADVDQNGLVEAVIKDGEGNKILLFYYRGSLYAGAFSAAETVILRDGTILLLSDGVTLHSRTVFYDGGKFAVVEICRETVSDGAIQYHVNGVLVSKYEYTVCTDSIADTECEWLVLR